MQFCLKLTLQLLMWLEADSAAADAAAGAWKSFTDQVSEVFEPAKPAEDPKPSQETPSTSSESSFLCL